MCYSVYNSFPYMAHVTTVPGPTVDAASIAKPRMLTTLSVKVILRSYTFQGCLPTKCYHCPMIKNYLLSMRCFD